jgi:hypothetical protein
MSSKLQKLNQLINEKIRKPMTIDGRKILCGGKMTALHVKELDRNLIFYTSELKSHVN